MVRVLLIASLLGAAACQGDGGAAPASEPVPAPVVEPAPAAVPPAEPQPAAVAPAASDDPPPCGDGEQCLDVASKARREGDLPAAVGALSLGCELGHAGCCYRLGVLHREGQGVDADDGRATDLFRTACAAGSSAACDALGH